MIKKAILFLVGSSLIFAINMKADEGMWLLTMLKKLNLNEKGLELTPEDIYSLNNSCVKDAIVGLGNEQFPFGFFCTAEIISDQGLMLTNHHCGYGAIQSHS
ncbi:MAG: S46 family peptidase, partial [Bacteroidota bacterium]